jgi:hypothetical protein
VTATRRPAIRRQRTYAPRGSSFPSKVDRDALHAYLWSKRDTRDRATIHMSKLAEALGVSGHTISDIMKKFCEEGRLTKVGNQACGVGVYRVADPAKYEPTKKKTWAADGKSVGTRKLLWG